MSDTTATDRHPEVLVQTIADALVADLDLRPSEDEAGRVLDAFPDGWAKVGGEWVQLTKVGIAYDLHPEKQPTWMKFRQPLYAERAEG